MYGRNSDECTRLNTSSPVRVVVSRLALGLALILTLGVADTWADGSKCDEVIADPDSGCSQGERCDAGTITCVKGGSEDTSGYVEICHRPPGCPGNTRTIRVSACALDGHLGHGDSIGACPECDSDDDCAAGEVCNLSTGFCIDPNGGCDDDSDCGGGQVCNLATGTCIDPDGPCEDDSDCCGCQVCNPETGLCQDPTDECAVDADCDDGLFCTGAETCDLLRGCKAGAVVCNDGVACTVDGCDEETDSCSNTASDVACDDGIFCNGAETCDAENGCVAGTAVDCGGGSEDFCAVGACDESTKGCVLEPQNDGLDCAPRDGDTCVLSAVCSAGACLVTPLCNEQCERCDPEGCASLCGNPFANGDDTVNTTDALFALRAAVELEECSLCVCDVNGDGAVTATDTLMMLRQVVGLGDLFVCPESAEPETTTTTITSTTTTTLQEIP
ncbi:MAG TPA: dockerin type I domain-containing protein [Candidatus Binatia bacterium]|nr:dockerin type I domain-containing protein [Candidatus Binatia bacterium]